MVKSLVLGALVTLCACDIPDVTFMKPGEAPDAPDAMAGDSRVSISASWKVSHASSGAQVACLGTASKIVVAAWDPVTLSLDPVTKEHAVACADGSATIELASGFYIAYMTILDSSGVVLMGSDLHRLDARQDATISFSFYDDAAVVAFAWALVDASGSKVSCDEAGIGSGGRIELISIPSTGPDVVDTFLCDVHVGSSSPLRPDTYSFEVTGLDAAHRAVTTTFVPRDRGVLRGSLVVLEDVFLTVP